MDLVAPRKQTMSSEATSSRPRSPYLDSASRHPSTPIERPDVGSRVVTSERHAGSLAASTACCARHSPRARALTRDVPPATWPCRTASRLAERADTVRLKSKRSDFLAEFVACDLGPSSDPGASGAIAGDGISATRGGSGKGTSRTLRTNANCARPLLTGHRVWAGRSTDHQ
jgi:hypothetical protein